MPHLRPKMTLRGTALTVGSFCLLLVLTALALRGGISFSQSGDPTDTSVIAPGLGALSIDGEGVTGPGSVVSDVSATPVFQGRLVPGSDTATIEIPEASLKWQLDVDEQTGSFTARAPEKLAPGNYTLEINGVKVASFSVAEKAAADGGDDDWLLLIIIAAAVAGGVGLIGGLVYLRSRQASR